MCGIIGYVGKGERISTIIEAIKSLEYRGYDSWGYAALTDCGIVLKRKVGKVGKVADFDDADVKADIMIGHTRWATHGAVSEKNAHPHISMDGKIVLVHNGIIENYLTIKKALKKKGFKFSSETDTEIIPNLIQYYMENGHDFKEASRKALLELKGSYAIVGFHADERKLLFARNSSPLVLGIGDSALYVASDAPAFLSHTNKAIFLDDFEYGLMQSKPLCFNIAKLSSNTSVRKRIDVLSLDIEQVRKGSYPHFMIKEIFEQPDVVRRVLAIEPGQIKKVLNLIASAKNVFLIGCGTSYHACLVGHRWFLQSGIASIPVLASEFEMYKAFLNGALVIALSQSGETADVLEAVRLARKHNCKVISIVNVYGSTLTRLSDRVLYMRAGPEICVLSTKSFISQLMILYILAKRSQNRVLHLKELPDIVKEVLEKNKDTASLLADKFKTAKDIFIIGKDYLYPIALEAALKIKEVSYIHAEGFAGAELKHGTIALIEKGIPVIVLYTKKTESILSNAAEVKSRGALLIGVGMRNECFERHLEVPEYGGLTPLLQILPIQLFAYYLAVKRGCDPDKPRNLAKSVTVK